MNRFVRCGWFFVLASLMQVVGCGPRGLWQRLEHPSSYSSVTKDDEALHSLESLRAETHAHPENTASVVTFLERTEKACESNGLFARRAEIKEPVDPKAWAIAATEIAIRAVPTAPPSTRADLFTRAARTLAKVGLKGRANEAPGPRERLRRPV